MMGHHGSDGSAPQMGDAVIAKVGGGTVEVTGKLRFIGMHVRALCFRLNSIVFAFPF